MENELHHAYSGLAGIYDRLMSDVDYEAWADYIHAFLAERGIKRVLDCACGTGAITIRLFRRGYDITGADVSEAMLRMAQENARRKRAGIPFVRQDMRFLSVHKPVDAIVCACDGVNYLSTLQDVHAFFQSAAGALRPGGLLLFDISTEYKLNQVIGCNTFAEALTDCAYIWENRYDPQNRVSEMELTCFEKQGMLYRRMTEQHLQRAHRQEELSHLLRENGFADVQIYDAFTRDLPAKNSERIQFVAERPQP